MTSPPCVASRARPRRGGSGPDARVRSRRAPRAARGCARWRSTTWRSIPRASSARGSASTATSRSPHCIAHVEERGNLDNLRRVTGLADGDFRGLPFADSDVYKTLEAAGWELARGPQPALDDFVDETTRLLARRPGGRRLPELLLPGRPPGPQAARVPLGPRDVLRRAPAPGRRRRRAQRPVAPTCWWSRRASPTCSCGASAGRARRRSTATPRSRPRSSSSIASPTRPPTCNSPRASSSCAATACSDPTASGPTTSRTTRPCARPPSRPVTPSASCTSRPASPTSTSRAPTTRCWPRWRSCGRT